MNPQSDAVSQRAVARGFTLIELLVVIAIIAILAAMLMPALARARQRALLATCQSNFHQVFVGCTVYANDYHDYYPICTTGNGNTGGKFNNLDFVDYTEYFWRGGSAANTPILPPMITNNVYDCLGYLYETKIIGSGKVCFCPGFQAGLPHSADYYSNPVFLSTGPPSSMFSDGTYNIQDSTLYNPRLQDATNGVVVNAPTDPQKTNPRAFPKTTSTWSRADSPANHRFATDFLSPSDNNVSAFAKGIFAHYPCKGFDVSFIDGSVRFVQSVPAFNMVANGQLPTSTAPASNQAYDYFSICWKMEADFVHHI